jgi:hypothetical protein
VLAWSNGDVKNCVARNGERVAAAVYGIGKNTLALFVRCFYRPVEADDALDATPLTFGSEQEAFRGRILAESKCPISKRRKLFIT